MCVNATTKQQVADVYLSHKRHVLNEYNHQFGHENSKLRFIPMIGICGSFQPYHRWYRINPHHGVVVGPGSLGKKKHPHIGGSSILNGQVLTFQWLDHPFS
jgi:hypothetical protein